MSDLRQEILAALINGPGYGLELAARLRERGAGGLPASGNLYPHLRALEREGLVESFEGEAVPERGGRPRIYYELTGEGQRVALGEAQGTRWGLVLIGGTEPALG